MRPWNKDLRLVGLPIPRPLQNSCLHLLCLINPPASPAQQLCARQKQSQPAGTFCHQETETVDLHQDYESLFLEPHAHIE